jgi:hypothetical protein
MGTRLLSHEEYSGWLLDGTLLPVGSTLTKAECRRLVEGSFAAAFQVVRQCRTQFKQPPDEADGYSLAILKLELSFAVRNNLPLQEAVRAYESTMGSPPGRI